MKNILNFKSAFFATLTALVLMTSCDLDETNHSFSGTDLVYTSPDGYEGLINYGYNSLYYFYGKLDGIGAQELGTDLWWSESRQSAYTQYNSELTTEQGQNNVFWQGFYSAINYANLAIYYADQVEGYDEAQKNAKVAEAYFIRGWSYLQLVEQFGGVVLRTEPSFVNPDEENFPVRSTEEEFYEVILSDLEFAVEHLPIDQGSETGRASKKAALGMLAKAYLQRTRLGDETTYATKALETAQELIDNQATYGCELWTSTATESGYKQLWDGPNNKGNKEFLFTEHIDIDGVNPEGFNRGRTRQYYLMDLKNVGAEWGTTEKNCAWYGRANSRGLKPTKYLLTEIFTPEEDPADTRFDNTFYSEYYNSRWSDYEITADLVAKYNKNTDLIGHEIKNTAGTYYSGTQYYGRETLLNVSHINASGNVNMEDADADGYVDGLSVFTPNFPMTAAEKADLPFLIVTPEEMFDADGKWVTDATSTLSTYYKECYPSLNKFSSFHWIINNQRWLGDIPILRLGDVYLIAAEAALRANNDTNTAATYVNAIRERAAISARAGEMTVAPGDIDLDFILAERARELAGEQVRWEDLKRFGKLSSTYFSTTNPDITSFQDNKHTVRPIPQAFLDAIGNADEFGTNGY